jgi:hypothetical protein
VEAEGAGRSSSHGGWVSYPPLLSRHRLAQHPVSPPRAPPPSGTGAGGLWTVDGQSAHDLPSFEVDLAESGWAELSPNWVTEKALLFFISKMIFVSKFKLLSVWINCTTCNMDHSLKKTCNIEHHQIPHNDYRQNKFQSKGKRPNKSTII